MPPQPNQRYVTQKQNYGKPPLQNEFQAFC